MYYEKSERELRESRAKLEVLEKEKSEKAAREQKERTNRGARDEAKSVGGATAYYTTNELYGMGRPKRTPEES